MTVDSLLDIGDLSWLFNSQISVLRPMVAMLCVSVWPFTLLSSQ